MSVILIHGANEYEARARLKELVGSYLSENSSESLRIIDGEDCETDEVVQALSAQSLFSSGSEMVVIKRIGNNSQLKEQLSEGVEELASTTNLVIYDPKIDKRSKLYKSLKKAKSTEEYTTLSEQELRKWIESEVKTRKGTIDNQALNMLVSRTKGDQVAISNELDKLLNFSRSIDEDSVGKLVELAPDDNVFDLLDKLASGNKPAALTRYNELRQAQMEAHYILVMISWQLGNMMMVKLGESKTERELATEAGMNPYTIRKTRALTSKLSRKRIKEMVQLAVDADIKLKTTSVDANQLIQNLIAKL